MNDTRRPTVLVIDDDPEVTDLYAEWLAATCEVRTARDGLAAIEALDEALDVVLLDRRMPGTSGDDVLETIRDRDLDVRVAMVTAVTPDLDVVEMGFDDYLIKPVTGDGLRETVERLMLVADYDDELQSLYALASKKAVLEAERPVHALESNPEYRALRREVSAAHDRLDDLGGDLDSAHYELLFRALGASEEPSTAVS